MSNNQQSQNNSNNLAPLLSVFSIMNFLGNNYIIYGDINNPMFLARDVAEVIDYAKTRKGSYDTHMMLKTVSQNNKFKFSILRPGPGGCMQKREAWFIDETGLFTLLMKSRKPKSYQFKDEVTKLLTNLRRTIIKSNP